MGGSKSGPDYNCMLSYLNGYLKTYNFLKWFIDIRGLGQYTFISAWVPSCIAVFVAEVGGEFLISFFNVRTFEDFWLFGSCGGMEEGLLI